MLIQWFGGYALLKGIFTEIITYFFGVGGGIAVSIREGQGDQREASQIFSLAVAGTAALGLLAALAGGFLAGPLLPLLGARTAAQQAAAGGYVRILLLGLPVLFLAGVLNVFIRNDNHPRLAMAGVLVSLGANLALLGLFLGVLRLPVFSSFRAG